MIGKMIIITTLLLTSPTLTAQTCYQIYNKDQELIWAKSEPPFDLSAPPLSAEYQASRARGERLLVTQTDECRLPVSEAMRTQEAAAAVAKSSGIAVTAIRRGMEKQERREQEIESYKQELNDLRREIVREGIRDLKSDVKDLKFQNDVRERFSR